MTGLLQDDFQDNISQFPVLGSIPVLGALFRSTGFKSGRTDLVIFVTPTVVDPTSTINRERLDKALDMQEKFQQRLGPKGIVD